LLHVGRQVARLRQVADVPDARLDLEVVAEVALDLASLGGRLDDHELAWLGHPFLLSLLLRRRRACADGGRPTGHVTVRHPLVTSPTRPSGGTLPRRAAGLRRELTQHEEGRERR